MTASTFRYNLKAFTAQPCSYIYPIYSVVKNREANRITAPSLSRPRAARAFLLKVQSPPRGDSTSSRHRLPYILNMPIEKYGGAERDRTVDPLLAKQVLSQLSYSPLVVYTTTMVSITNRRDKWWAWVDSNYRPHPYQGCALTN